MCREQDASDSKAGLEAGPRAQGPAGASVEETGRGQVSEGLRLRR